MANTCDICEFEARTPQGLAGHKRLAHPSGGEHSGEILVEAPAPDPPPLQEPALDDNSNAADSAGSELVADFRSPGFSALLSGTPPLSGRVWHLEPAPICHRCGEPCTHWQECAKCQKLLPLDHDWLCWRDLDTCGMAWEELMEAAK